MATCVSSEYFVQMIGHGRASGNKTRPRISLDGRMASMMISKPDGNTPIEADTMVAQPWLATDYVNDPDAEGLSLAHSMQTKCRDCVELETQQFEKGTAGLKTQVKLLTTSAAAGVIWLTLLSG